MNTQFRYENGNSLRINDQTDNYTLTPDDNGAVVVITSGSGKNLTVPTLLPIGFNCLVKQGGAGQITIVESSTSVNNLDGHSKTADEGAVVSLISCGADEFDLVGQTGA